MRTAYSSRRSTSLFNRASSSIIIFEALNSSSEAEVALMDTAQVEVLVGFEIKEPQSIPSGYAFAGAG